MDRARRAMPIGNKACHARFVKAQQERHKKKLREMKASIDTKAPHTRQGGKRRNPKKEQMMEERRNWFTDVMVEGHFPENLNGYYLMKNPPPPEEDFFASFGV